MDLAKFPKIVKQILLLEEVIEAIPTFRFSRLAPCVNTLHSRNAAARVRRCLRTSIRWTTDRWWIDVTVTSAQLLKAARATGFWKAASA